MTATRGDVNRWIETAKKNGDNYIISVCDTFDYDDYPIYCKSKGTAKEQFEEHNGHNMQRVNEIIRINEDGTVTENLTIHSLNE